MSDKIKPNVSKPQGAWNQSPDTSDPPICNRLLFKDIFILWRYVETNEVWNGILDSPEVN